MQPKHSTYKLLLLIICLFPSFGAIAQHRTLEQTETIKVPGILADTAIYGLSATQKTTSRTYFDGFGRPVQQVAVQASGSQKDLIIPIVYDSQGRQTKSYLPYTDGAATGDYRPTALTGQNTFYNNGLADKVADDSMPFSDQLIENSPLQRMLQAGSVGSGFQPGQHYSAVNYRANSNTLDGTIIRWLPDGSRPGSYSDTTLSVTEATGPDGNKALSYTDRSGRTILKRQVLDATHNTDTYYIYNNAGAISYVVPPKAVKILTDNPTYTLSQASVAALIYKYIYDDRGRLMSKTVPGSGDLYVIYDPLDRPVLLQNANLRATNRWNFIKYDVQGRAVIQGYYTDATRTTPAAMQTYVDGLAAAYATTWYEGRSSTSTTEYYTNNVFPTTGATILACSYYDDYDLNYDANHVADFSYTAQGLTGEATATGNTRGMLTISRTRSVGSGLAGAWFNKLIFYDKRGNVIQVKSNNQLVSTLNDVATSVPDFTGVTLQTKVVKTHGASLTTTVLSTYTYDHMLRPKTVKQKYNTGEETTLATYEYNELGQLTDKKLGISATNPALSLQSVDYRYNIRGQLLSINNSKLNIDTLNNDDSNDVFGEELLYDKSNTQVGNTASYSGQLSAVKWMSLNESNVKSNERSYKYSYDGLGRFTQALYAERLSTATAATSFTLNPGGFDEKGITYDENGNIQSMQRNSSTVGGSAGTAIDNLTYAYDSSNLNKLLTVTDASSAAAGFRNYTGNTTNSYTYDGAGNLTADPYKGIASITYNVLNRVDKVTLTYPSPATTGRYIDYTYDATGKLIRKRQYDNSALIKTTDYIDGFIYTTLGAGAAQLDYFGMPEGRVRNTGGATITLKQEFIITDHQGNARISFEDNGSGVAVVKQENSYYAYGMSMTSTMSPPTAPNKNLYNGGSEWQNDYQDQPDWQQTFYRNYDQTTGRFLAVDPMAEETGDMSVYQYGNNNPILFNDPLGDLSKAEFQNVLNTLGNSKYGGEWHSNSPNSVTAYGDDLMGFYMASRFMSDHNMFGLHDGWAQNYNVGAANYNGNTSGDRAAYSNGQNIVVGEFFHDTNGNAITINGVSGQFESIATQALKTNANSGGESFDDKASSIGLIIDSQEAIYSTAKIGAENTAEWIGKTSKGLGLVGATITGGIAAKHLISSFMSGHIGSARDWVNLGIGAASAAIILNPEALGVTELGEAAWDTGTAVWDAIQIGIDHHNSQQ